MGEGAKKAKKRQILNRLFKYLNQYSQVLLIQLENVGSNQIQDARFRLRSGGIGEMLVAKNTVFKKGFAMRQAALDPEDPDFEFRKPLWNKNIVGLEKLSALCKEKVGLIFTDRPTTEVKTLIEGNRRAAAARVGMLAPMDFTIPPGPTGMDPSQISFFHALSIPTKINKGQIEITKDFKVATKGKKIGNSEASLLQKLNLKPFSFGLEIKNVFTDGSILGPEIFNMDLNALCDKFTSHARLASGLALGINYPCELSVPHMVSNGFKNIASLALASNLKLKQLEGLGTAAPAKKEEPKKEAKKEEPKKAEPKKEEPKVEDEDVGLGGGMFDDF
mmetsp:Transcript_78070/g.91132  ORF Transcript_78070/g.91132 Transcript_78070/m.91132 type:complete len:333 (+) Transcript_78070:57-1055(+)